MNLAQRITEQASATPDAIAFRTEAGDTTFGEFDALATQIAGGLAGTGVRGGDRIAIMAGSHVEYVASLVAIWKLGAITVALNAQLSPDEARYQITNSGARVIISDPARSREVVDQAARGSAVERIFDIGQLRSDSFEPPPWVSDEADATIFYTSGTTGVPKGAVHTHRALGVLLEEMRIQYQLDSADNFLAPAPIYLLGPLLMGPLASLTIGASCRLMPRYEPLLMAEAVRQDKTTVIVPMVPVMLYDFLSLDDDQAEQVDFSSVRFAFFGGSPVPAETRRSFEKQFDFQLLHSFGSTEGPGLAAADPLDRPRKFDSVGPAIPHIRISIEDDGGNEVAANAIGEVCTSAHTSGPYAGRYETMRCYWGMPEATADALRAGKLHWGDLGYLDDEGYLYIVDRKKDMIIRGGVNVYPKELEVLLYEDARIAECAVVGAPHPRYVEVPVAFVRIADGASISGDEVLELVNGRTAKFKHLHGVTFVDDFPRNALGKILKRELRDSLANA